MEKEIEIIRGDTKALKFQRKSNGEPIKEIATKLYFTVKKSSYDDEVLFQKTLDDMDFDEEYYYHFTIEPEDTNGLDYAPEDKPYVYDIEVIQGTYKKTISRGSFVVTDEVTHVGNEV